MTLHYFFCPERLNDLFFLPRGFITLFGPERLHNFFCPKRLHDFFFSQEVARFFCLESMHDFICPKRLRDFFFLPRGCVIFLSSEVT